MQGAASGNSLSTDINDVNNDIKSTERQCCALAYFLYKCLPQNFEYCSLYIIKVVCCVANAIVIAQ